MSECEDAEDAPEGERHMAHDGSSAASGRNDAVASSKSAPVADADASVVVADLNKRPHHDEEARRRRPEADDDDEAAAACAASSLSGTSTIIFCADLSSFASGENEGCGDASQ